MGVLVPLEAAAACTVDATGIFAMGATRPRELELIAAAAAAAEAEAAIGGATTEELCVARAAPLARAEEAEEDDDPEDAEASGAGVGEVKGDVGGDVGGESVDAPGARDLSAMAEARSAQSRSGSKELTVRDPLIGPLRETALLLLLLVCDATELWL